MKLKTVYQGLKLLKHKKSEEFFLLLGAPLSDTSYADISIYGIEDYRRYYETSNKFEYLERYKNNYRINVAGLEELITELIEIDDELKWISKELKRDPETEAWT